MHTQLLCTFTDKSNLTTVLDQVQNTYNVVYNYIYILQNKTNLDELFVTYNIDTDYKPHLPLHNTILVHRKKEYNTLYTINALNELVKEENYGVLDKNFIIDWEQLRNSIVITNNEGTNKIPTRIYDILEFSKN